MDLDESELLEEKPQIINLEPQKISKRERERIIEAKRRQFEKYELELEKRRLMREIEAKHVPSVKLEPLDREEQQQKRQGRLQKAMKLKNETEDQRNNRLEKIRIASKIKYQNETSEERRKRLDKVRLNSIQKFKNEIEENRQRRLKRCRIYKKNHLISLNLNPEEREKHLEKHRNYSK